MLSILENNQILAEENVISNMLRNIFNPILYAS